MSDLTLDNNTVFLVSGLVYIILPGLTWLGLKQHRSQATKWWCIGCLLSGMGVVLVGLRGALPLAWTMGAAQTLIIYSLLLGVVSLRLEMRLKAFHGWALGLSALNGWILMALIIWAPDPWLSLWPRTLIMGVFALFAWHIVLLIRTLHSRSAHIMLLSYGLLLVMAVLLWVQTLMGHSTVLTYTGSSIMKFYALAALLSSVLGNMGYMGVAYERGVRTAAQSRAQALGHIQRQNLHQNLLDLDRQLSLGAMLNSLSHGIRQPLSSMLLQARHAQQRLARDPSAIGPVIEALGRIVADTERTSNTIGHIRGFIQPASQHMARFGAADLLRNVQVLVGQEAHHRGRPLLLNAPPTCLLHGDVLQLTQAWVSVLRHLLQHPSTGLNDSIALTIGAEKDKISLKSHYFGVALQDADLALSRMIAHQHGGEVHHATLTTQSHCITIDLPLTEPIMLTL